MVVSQSSFQGTVLFGPNVECELDANKIWKLKWDVFDTICPAHMKSFLWKVILGALQRGENYL